MEPTTFCLTFELLEKFSHHVLPLLWRQQCSNTKKLRVSPAVNGHAYEQHSCTDFIDAVYTLPLTNRISCCRRLKFVNASQVFRMREDTSSYCDYQLTRSQLLICKNKVQLRANQVLQQHFTLQICETYTKYTHVILQTIDNSLQLRFPSRSTRLSRYWVWGFLAWSNIDATILTGR